jgi:tetratricopeptide (TPR) repeat protein
MRTFSSSNQTILVPCTCSESLLVKHGERSGPSKLVDKAITLKPDLAEAHGNRGNALMDKRPAEALASYDKAIALKPDLAEAHNNRGNALRRLLRPADNGTATVSSNFQSRCRLDMSSKRNQGNRLCHTSAAWSYRVFWR